MTQPLMPKATAVWLIEKTSLTFEQVADFVGMHPLEVQAIADGEVAQGIIGYDPVLNGQLTREEIARCEADPSARLQIGGHSPADPEARGKGAKYTPVSKRNDRPDAIAWVLRHYPHLTRCRGGQAARHHQGDDRQGARPDPLEQRQHQAARSGHPRPLQPGRPECRGRAPRTSGPAAPLPVPSRIPKSSRPPTEEAEEAAGPAERAPGVAPAAAVSASACVSAPSRL